MQKPPVIILAGGSNSRFFPFNTLTHKGGLTLHGKSFLARTLENLKDHDFNEVIVVISPKDEANGALKDAVQQTNQTLQLQMTFVVQPEAKGMGDAVLTGLSVIDLKNVNQVAIIFPYHISAGELLDNMSNLGETCLCTSETENPSNYGIVHLNQAGEVDGIVEKPENGTAPSNQKVLGLYLVSKKFLELLQRSPITEYSFEAVLNSFLQTSPAPKLKLALTLPTLKYPWDLFSFQNILFKTMHGTQSSEVSISKTAVIDESKGPVQIEAGAKIGHSTKIVGPVYIGKNVRVGDFCLIRETSLEENVLIGSHTEVARSIFMTGSTVHRGYVGDSIIGNDTKLGAGFITANKRFDRKTIPVEIKGKLIDSGKRALGVCIGENVQVGTLVNTMPGKCIGSNSFIFPGSIIYQNVPAGASIRPDDLPRETK